MEENIKIPSKKECCPAPCFSGMRVDGLPAERYQKLGGGRFRTRFFSMESE